MAIEQTTDPDPREHHLRALALLMLSGPTSKEFEDYLDHREYGLALEVLANDVKNA